MTQNEALKQLMLGLIYPAILGTVFYNFLGAALGPASATREFVFAFFVCDLVLLAGLYVTFSAIDISSNSHLPRRSLIIIASCYAIFMMLYLIWDLFERSRSPDTAERLLYKKVIVWEVVSIFMLLIWLALEWLMPSFSLDSTALLVVVTVVTVWFGRLVLKKRELYRAPTNTN